MPFCGKCGSAVAEGAAFCSRCGEPVTPPFPYSSVTSSAMASNIAAVLSCVFGFISGIIFLLVEPYKNDSFVRFHAYQSILWSVALLAFGIVWKLVCAIFLIGFLWTLANLLYNLICLALFVYWLFLMYKAYNRERYMIPYLGELAARQAGV